LSLEARNPYELFNEALEAFGKADLQSAVVMLRAAFFSNLYIAPLLLGEEYQPLRIWYAGADGEPLAAREYTARYGRLWESRPEAIRFLHEVWNDPSVRAELRAFINLSKNLLSAREADLEERLKERSRFLNGARLERTQSEILSRLARTDLKRPLAPPRMALVLLASKDPAASERFYRSLLEVEPARTHGVGGGYAEFEFEGVHFAIHGRHRASPADPFLLGPAPQSFGWGAIFVFRVANLERYLENATTMGAEVVDSDLTTPGRRSFVVKDPSGYVVEVTEEEPRGIEDGP